MVKCNKLELYINCLKESIVDLPTCIIVHSSRVYVCWAIVSSLWILQLWLTWVLVQVSQYWLNLPMLVSPSFGQLIVSYLNYFTNTHKRRLYVHQFANIHNLLTFYTTIASVHFIKEMVPADRKALAMYPVFLFYLFLSWFIILWGGKAVG